MHASVKVTGNFGKQMNVEEWKVQKKYCSGVVEVLRSKNSCSRNAEELNVLFFLCISA